MFEVEELCNIMCIKSVAQMVAEKVGFSLSSGQTRVELEGVLCLCVCVCVSVCCR